MRSRDAFAHLKTSGFTLIELTVAIAIFAVVGTALFSGLKQLIEVKHSLEEKINLNRSIQRTLGAYRSDASHLVNRGIRLGSGSSEAPLSINTSKNQLLLLTRTTNDIHGEVLERVAYRLDDNRLIRERWPVLDRMYDTSPKKRILISQIKAASIRVLDSKGYWHTVWPPMGQKKNTLEPTALELELVLASLGRMSSLVSLNMPIAEANFTTE